MKGPRISISICLAVAMSVLAATAPAEAGLFDKLKAKRQAKQRAKAAEQQPVKKYRAPVKRSWYRDEHQDAYINQALLDAAGEEAERKVIIDIERQRAFLVIDGLVAIDTAVSTARSGYVTPRGTYPITEKIRSGKVSTLYHCYMPNWMRLGHSMIGMHVGDLPGYPASHGCIRMPQTVAPVMFDHVPRGTSVEVVDTWDEKDLKLPYTFPHPMYFTAL